MVRVLKILGFTVMWVAILGAIVMLAMRARASRDELLIREVEITIVDSVERGNLVTVEMVEQMLQKQRVKMEGEVAHKLPLTHIENLIGGNGFVESVKAYVTYDGVLCIDVEQRDAIARLVLDGYNSYITRDGFIFGAPSTAAMYCSVITGEYRPLFGAGYVGSVDDCAAKQIAKLEQEIERIEREKYPIYIRIKANNADKKDLRSSFTKPKFLEPREEFERRVDTLRKDNSRRRALYAYRDKIIDEELKALEQRQDKLRGEQKKVTKRCEDIYNLITFVDMVENDDFWRSEIVQIDVERCETGEMRVALAVRSGDFIVTLGALGSSRDAMESKLERLKNFYEEALPRVGWGRYRYINIEFENQVVCKR